MVPSPFLPFNSVLRNPRQPRALDAQRVYPRTRGDAMYTHAQRLSAKQTQKLRREAGRWLRGLREERGLSQRELARKVGAKYYTFISQLENGRGRIPPDRYLIWARALSVDPHGFVRGLMSYYDPITYGIIFRL